MTMIQCLKLKDLQITSSKILFRGRFWNNPLRASQLRCPYIISGCCEIEIVYSETLSLQEEVPQYKV